MPSCSRPLTAWPSLSGGRPSFKPGLPGFSSLPIKVQCGQCLVCKTARAVSTATRCVAELQCRPDDHPGTFATLTYSDEHLWSPGGRPSLHPRHVQLFMKSLRKKHGPVRYYVAGEYGDKTERPHYHALLFHRRFTNHELELVWKRGSVHCDDLNSATIMYTAQYVTKKLYGSLAAQHYSDRFPPFALQSQSLGRGYLEAYIEDIKRTGKVYIPDAHTGGGHLAPLPRTMLQRLKEREPEVYARLLALRREAAQSAEDPDTYQQHRKETSLGIIAHTRASHSRRDYE